MPDSAEALHAQGLTAMRDRQPARAIELFSQAIQAHSRAIELRPDHASSRLNRSMMRLMRGEYELGWEEHEWRWKTPQLAASFRSFPQPVWDGADLRGKTVLLWAEQGLGDT